MLVENFLSKHGLRENPFEAEEARDDPVLERLLDSGSTHPDFAKILGRIDHPTTSVVFGEKGSGKTAIRLLVSRRVAAHNVANPGRRTMLVAYDDLNPVIDRVVNHVSGGSGQSVEDRLASIKLEDHQDAILALAVTRLVALLLDTTADTGGAPQRLMTRARKLSRSARAKLAVVAALYDQGDNEPLRRRWQRLCAGLRLRTAVSAGLMRNAATAFVVLGLVSLGVGHLIADRAEPLYMAGGMAVALGLVLLGAWARRHVTAWRISRQVSRQIRATGRTAADLRWILLGMRKRDLADQPWPTGGPEGRTSRYQLTAQFIDVLHLLDYTGVMVLVDRVDEPTLVSGNDQRMRSIIWPMLDNKFLQQEGLGFKLLLPIELRYHLLRESPQFFQEARLDKQNLLERLVWSGATLYDLCSARLAACSQPAAGGKDHPVSEQGLMALFADDVTRDMIVDALDTMQQPRDAFKFLYGLIQEHCRVVPDDHPVFQIPRLTVEVVRRSQSQRVSDFQRGLGPG